MTICDTCFRYGSEGEKDRRCYYGYKVASYTPAPPCTGTMRIAIWRRPYETPILNGIKVPSSGFPDFPKKGIVNVKGAVRAIQRTLGGSFSVH